MFIPSKKQWSVCIWSSRVFLGLDRISTNKCSTPH